MTENRTYFAAADILRILCIGLIAWYHFWQQSWLNPGFSLLGHYVNLQQLVRNGYMMVDLLLVLSGFLLALPYAGAAAEGLEPPSPRAFYIKRFWRIVPSYALAVMLILFLYALPNRLYGSPAALLKDLLTHFTFTHNLTYDSYFLTPLPGVLWTLAVEVQFYVLFPAIACLYREKPSLTCLVLILIALTVRLWVYHLPVTNFWVNQLPCMLDLFACGMLAAHIHVRLDRRNLSDGVRWLMALAALLCLLLLFQIVYRQVIGDYEEVRRSQLVWRLPLGALGGIFLVCGAQAPQGLNRVLGNPVTRFLSGITYNFYIWHQFLAVRLKAWHIPAYTSELPNQAGEQPWQLRYTLLCFAAAALVAAAVTFFWEKPIAKHMQKALR